MVQNEEKCKSYIVNISDLEKCTDVNTYNDDAALS